MYAKHKTDTMCEYYGGVAQSIHLMFVHMWLWLRCDSPLRWANCQNIFFNYL